MRARRGVGAAPAATATGDDGRKVLSGGDGDGDDSSLFLCATATGNMGDDGRHSPWVDFPKLLGDGDLQLNTHTKAALTKW